MIERRGSVVLKTAVKVTKIRPCFDPSAGSGSARTIFEALTQLVRVRSPLYDSSKGSDPNNTSSLIPEERLAHEGGKACTLKGV